MAPTREDWNGLPTRVTDLTCPECGGAIRLMDGEPRRRYRCRVGHVYGEDGFMDANEAATEKALWVALQSLQERRQLLDRMASEERARGRVRSAADLEERAQETQAHAEMLRGLVDRTGR